MKIGKKVSHLLLHYSTKQAAKTKVSHLSSGVQVADGVCFKVTFILPAQYSCDDDDNQGDHGDGGQHCGHYPQVVRRVLDHGWDKEEQMCSHVLTKPPNDKTLCGWSWQLVLSTFCSSHQNSLESSVQQWQAPRHQPHLPLFPCAGLNFPIPLSLEIAVQHPLPS